MNIKVWIPVISQAKAQVGYERAQAGAWRTVAPQGRGLVPCGLSGLGQQHKQVGFSMCFWNE